jgi:hypothetical protein
VHTSEIGSGIKNTSILYATTTDLGAEVVDDQGAEESAGEQTKAWGSGEGAVPQAGKGIDGRGYS